MDKGEFVSLCDWKDAFGARAATFDYIKGMSLCVADGAAFWNGGSMLSDSEKALAEMMAAQFMDKGDAAAVEPAEGTVKITFFEKGNTVDSSIEGIASRMRFDGCFAIDEYMIQRKDGTPVDAGFGADFNDAGGPVASWVWFSRPVNGPVRAKFEERFNGTFDEEGLRMDIPTDDFLAFADSGAWNAFAVEDDEDNQVLFE